MRKRAISILFRVNEQEHQHFKEQVALSGYSAEEYLRRLIAQQDMKPRPADEMADIRRQLSAIGNNINQLAKKANAIGRVTAEDIQQIIQHQEQIWSVVKRL